MDEKFDYIDKFGEYYLDSLEDFEDLGIYRFNDIDLNWLDNLLGFSESIFGEDGFDAFSIVSQIFYGAVYVLKEKNKDEIIGIAALNRCWTNDVHMVYLAEYSIGEKGQGLGLGSRFLGRILYNLREQGVERIRLTVGIDNDPAIALYNKLGFEVIKEQKHLYGRGEHRYIMEKDLVNN